MHGTSEKVVKELTVFAYSHVSRVFQAPPWHKTVVFFFSNSGEGTVHFAGFFLWTATINLARRLESSFSWPFSSTFQEGRRPSWWRALKLKRRYWFNRNDSQPVKIIFGSSFLSKARGLKCWASKHRKAVTNRNDTEFFHSFSLGAWTCQLRCVPHDIRHGLVLTKYFSEHSRGVNSTIAPVIIWNRTILESLLRGLLYLVEKTLVLHIDAYVKKGKLLVAASFRVEVPQPLTHEWCVWPSFFINAFFQGISFLDGRVQSEKSTTSQEFLVASAHHFQTWNKQKRAYSNEIDSIS